jgi:MioC protein
MLKTASVINSASSFRLRGILKSTLAFLKPKSHNKPRVHDFTAYESGQDYSFEPNEQRTGGTITGQHSGVNAGDYLTLCINNQRVKYRIEVVDYYADPPDMWVAALSLVNS